MMYSGYYRSPYDSTPSYIHELREAGVRMAQRSAIGATLDRVIEAIDELVPDYLTPTAARMLADRIDALR